MAVGTHDRHRIELRLSAVNKFVTFGLEGSTNEGTAAGLSAKVNFKYKRVIWVAFFTLDGSSRSIRAVSH